MSVEAETAAKEEEEKEEEAEEEEEEEAAAAPALTAIAATVSTALSRGGGQRQKYNESKTWSFLTRRFTIAFHGPISHFALRERA